MIIKRAAFQLLKAKLEPGKIVVLYGPRRTGKTFLLQQLAKELGQFGKVTFLNAERASVQNSLSSREPEKLASFLGDTSVLIVDEAQRIPETGLNLKILVDSFPRLKIVASGSASFDLSQKLGEPLTGRKKTINLYPVSAQELIETKDRFYFESIFEHHLIYGGYPERFTLSSLEKQEEYLAELIDSYLFKDILEMENVRKPKKIRDLLTLLAFQVGKEVSLSELGNSLDLSKNTIYRYLDLLEKSFVVINVRGFSRNLRKEVVKSSRYFFYDNGVRNALINNFNPVNLRDDLGMLWENYLVVERLKRQSYQPILSNNYFWRTYDQKELDWVEERKGKLFGYEFKWGSKTAKVPLEWKQIYPKSEYQLINRENFLDFVCW